MARSDAQVRLNVLLNFNKADLQTQLRETVGEMNRAFQTNPASIDFGPLQSMQDRLAPGVKATTEAYMALNEQLRLLNTQLTEAEAKYAALEVESRGMLGRLKTGLTPSDVRQFFANAPDAEIRDNFSKVRADAIARGVTSERDIRRLEAQYMQDYFNNPILPGARSRVQILGAAAAGRGNKLTEAERVEYAAFRENYEYAATAPMMSERDRLSQLKNEWNTVRQDATQARNISNDYQQMSTTVIEALNAMQRAQSRWAASVTGFNEEVLKSTQATTIAMRQNLDQMVGAAKASAFQANAAIRSGGGIAAADIAGLRNTRDDLINERGRLMHLAETGAISTADWALLQPNLRATGGQINAITKILSQTGGIEPLSMYQGRTLKGMLKSVGVVSSENEINSLSAALDRMYGLRQNEAFGIIDSGEIGAVGSKRLSTLNSDMAAITAAKARLGSKLDQLGVAASRGTHQGYIGDISARLGEISNVTSIEDLVALRTAYRAHLSAGGTAGMSPDELFDYRTNSSQISQAFTNRMRELTGKNEEVRRANPFLQALGYVAGGKWGAGLFGAEDEPNPYGNQKMNWFNRLNHYTTNFASLAGIGLYGLGTVGAIGGLTKGAVGAYTDMTSTELALTGMANTYNKFVDAQGKAVSQQQNLNKAIEYSHQLYSQITDIAKKSVLTPQAIAEGYGRAGGALRNVGLTDTQALNIYGAFAGVGRLGGYGEYMVESSLIQLMRGQISSRNRLLYTLGFNSAEGSKLKELFSSGQTEKGYELIMGNLNKWQPVLQQAQNSPIGQLNQLSIEFQQVMQTMGSTVVPEIIPALKQFREELEKLKDTGEIAKFGQMLGQLSTVVIDGGTKLIDFVSPFITDWHSLVDGLIAGLIALRVGMVASAAAMSNPVSAILVTLGGLVAGMIALNHQAELANKKASDTLYDFTGPVSSTDIATAKSKVIQEMHDQLGAGRSVAGMPPDDNLSAWINNKQNFDIEDPLYRNFLDYYKRTTGETLSGNTAIDLMTGKHGEGFRRNHPWYLPDGSALAVGAGPSQSGNPLEDLISGFGKEYPQYASRSQDLYSFFQKYSDAYLTADKEGSQISLGKAIAQVRGPIHSQALQAMNSATNDLVLSLRKAGIKNVPTSYEALAQFAGGKYASQLESEAQNRFDKLTSGYVPQAGELPEEQTKQTRLPTAPKEMSAAEAEAEAWKLLYARLGRAIQNMPDSYTQGGQLIKPQLLYKGLGYEVSGAISDWRKNLEQVITSNGGENAIQKVDLELVASIEKLEDNYEKQVRAIIDATEAEKAHTTILKEKIDIQKQELDIMKAQFELSKVNVKAPGGLMQWLLGASNVMGMELNKVNATTQSSLLEQVGIPLAALNRAGVPFGSLAAQYGIPHGLPQAGNIGLSSFDPSYDTKALALSIKQWADKQTYTDENGDLVNYNGSPVPHMTTIKSKGQKNGKVSFSDSTLTPGSSFIDFISDIASSIGFADPRKYPHHGETTGGHHLPGSAHYVGRAVDVGTTGHSYEQVLSLFNRLNQAGISFTNETQYDLPGHPKVFIPGDTKGHNLHVQLMGSGVKVSSGAYPHSQVNADVLAEAMASGADVGTILKNAGLTIDSPVFKDAIKILQLNLQGQSIQGDQLSQNEQIYEKMFGQASQQFNLAVGPQQALAGEISKWNIEQNGIPTSLLKSWLPYRNASIAAFQGQQTYDLQMSALGQSFAEQAVPLMQQYAKYKDTKFGSVIQGQFQQLLQNTMGQAAGYQGTLSGLQSNVVDMQKVYDIAQKTLQQVGENAKLAADSLKQLSDLQFNDFLSVLKNPYQVTSLAGSYTQSLQADLGKVDNQVQADIGQMKLAILNDSSLSPDEKNRRLANLDQQIPTITNSLTAKYRSQALSNYSATSMMQLERNDSFIAMFGNALDAFSTHKGSHYADIVNGIFGPIGQLAGKRNNLFMQALMGNTTVNAQGEQIINPETGLPFDLGSVITGMVGSGAPGDFRFSIDQSKIKTIQSNSRMSGVYNAVGQLASGFIANSFGNNSQYAQMGGSLGGVLSAAGSGIFGASGLFGLGAAAGPVGMIAGTLLGGLLGNLFGRHHVEDPAIQKWRESVASLLSNINKSLRPQYDYFRTGQLPYGVASAWYSGRAYSQLGLQAAILPGVH